MNEETTAILNPEVQQPHALTLAAILRHVELVEHVLHKVMKEGTHFGESFPGDKKKNLLKPGADKLCLAFQLAPSFVVDERQLPNDHREYRITCKLTTPSGRVMGEGVGSCSTMESKYRWRNSARKCPNCGKETIIKGKEEYGGGWLCFAKKGGCNSKWEDGAKVIESQEGGKVENADIADVFNTCLKIGKKRAYVDATITATAASDLFTQDIEDLQNTAVIAEKQEAAREAQRQPVQQQVAAKPTPTAPAATPAPTAIDATKTAATGVTKTDCEKVYYRVVKAIGEKPAKIAWKPFADHAARLVGLTKILDACNRIVAAVGEDHGGRIIGDCVDNYGNDQMAPDKVAAFIEELDRLSHGEVVSHDEGPT